MHWILKLYIYIYIFNAVHQHSDKFRSFLEHLQGVFTSIKHTQNADGIGEAACYLSGPVGVSVFIKCGDIMIVRARQPRAMLCYWRLYLMLIPLCFYTYVYRKQTGFFEILYDGES